MRPYCSVQQTLRQTNGVEAADREQVTLDDLGQADTKRMGQGPVGPGGQGQKRRTAGMGVGEHGRHHAFAISEIVAQGGHRDLGCNSQFAQ